jgi:sugar/nucleoside kinase (ribokinase family)
MTSTLRAAADPAAAATLDAAAAAASANATAAPMAEHAPKPLTFHVVGDAFVDFFCYLEGDWPERGGDSVLDQPVKAYAGGSSVNTATHLTSLIAPAVADPDGGSKTNPFRSKPPSEADQHRDVSSFVRLPNSSVVLQTALNEDDHYGKILLEHTDRHRLNLVNCLRRIPAGTASAHAKAEAAATYRGGLVNGYHEKPGPAGGTTMTTGAASAESTGHCVAIVSKGERSFMTHRGCVESFQADHLVVDAMISGRNEQGGDDVLHLHVAGYFNMTGFWNGRLRMVLERIRAERHELNPGSSTTVSLVTQHDASDQWDGGVDDLMPLIDFFIMNELEANKILLRTANGRAEAGASSSPSPGADPIVAAWINHFSSRSPTTYFVVTRGADGAVAFRNFRRVATLHPAVAVPVVDPTGAGDSFTAGFLYGIWSRKRQSGRTADDDGAAATEAWLPDDIKQGLLWGCAVGTSAVTIRGASVPSRLEDIMGLYERQKAKETFVS